MDTAIVIGANLFTAVGELKKRLTKRRKFRNVIGGGGAVGNEIIMKLADGVDSLTRLQLLRMVSRTVNMDRDLSRFSPCWGEIFGFPSRIAETMLTLQVRESDFSDMMTNHSPQVERIKIGRVDNVITIQIGVTKMDPEAVTTEGRRLQFSNQGYLISNVPVSVRYARDTTSSGGKTIFDVSIPRNPSRIKKDHLTEEGDLNTALSIFWGIRDFWQPQGRQELIFVDLTVGEVISVHSRNEDGSNDTESDVSARSTDDMSDDSEDLVFKENYYEFVEGIERSLREARENEYIRVMYSLDFPPSHAVSEIVARDTRDFSLVSYTKKRFLPLYPLPMEHPMDYMETFDDRDFDVYAFAESKGFFRAHSPYPWLLLAVAILFGGTSQRVGILMSTVICMFLDAAGRVDNPGILRVTFVALTTLPWTEYPTRMGLFNFLVMMLATVAIALAPETIAYAGAVVRLSVLDRITRPHSQNKKSPPSRTGSSFHLHGALQPHEDKLFPPPPPGTLSPRIVGEGGTMDLSSNRFSTPEAIAPRVEGMIEILRAAGLSSTTPAILGNGRIPPAIVAAGCFAAERGGDARMLEFLISLDCQSRQAADDIAASIERRYQKKKKISPLAVSIISRMSPADIFLGSSDSKMVNLDSPIETLSDEILAKNGRKVYRITFAPGRCRMEDINPVGLSNWVGDVCWRRNGELWVHKQHAEPLSNRRTRRTVYITSARGVSWALMLVRKCHVSGVNALMMFEYGVALPFINRFAPVVGAMSAGDVARVLLEIWALSECVASCYSDAVEKRRRWGLRGGAALTKWFSQGSQERMCPVPSDNGADWTQSKSSPRFWQEKLEEKEGRKIIIRTFREMAVNWKRDETPVMAAIATLCSADVNRTTQVPFGDSEFTKSSEWWMHDADDIVSVKPARWSDSIVLKASSPAAMQRKVDRFACESPTLHPLCAIISCRLWASLCTQIGVNDLARRLLEDPERMVSPLGCLRQDQLRPGSVLRSSSIKKEVQKYTKDPELQGALERDVIAFIGSTEAIANSKKNNHAGYVDSLSLAADSGSVLFSGPVNAEGLRYMKVKEEEEVWVSQNGLLSKKKDPSGKKVLGFIPIVAGANGDTNRSVALSLVRGRIQFSLAREEYMLFLHTLYGIGILKDLEVG